MKEFQPELIPNVIKQNLKEQQNDETFLVSGNDEISGVFANDEDALPAHQNADV